MRGFLGIPENLEKSQISTKVYRYFNPQNEKKNWKKKQQIRHVFHGNHSSRDLGSRKNPIP